jgi:hypothetical protein
MEIFDAFLEELKTNLLTLAQSEFNEFTEEATVSGVTFAIQVQNDLVRWAQQHTAGLLSDEDFEWLLLAKKDLVELKGLKQLGLAAIRLDNFVNSLVTVVVSTAISALK